MEQVPRFELSVSKFGAPEYDDILNSDLPKEEKVKQIKIRGQQYEDEINRGAMLDNIRMGLGTALSAASFHPILNIPYVGTGLGGAMYDLGQGIVEGDTAGDLAKRAGRGFVIGETVGAVPYVGKLAGKTKAGQAVSNSVPVQAVGNVLNKAGEKFANSKLYDALMTDVRAFNPNKQIVYHGSPYDFNKFSNEAIGTGEGAQAHGYGHYAALNKGVADKRYRKRLTTSSKEEVAIDNKYKPLYEEAEKKYDNLLNNLYKQKQNGEITEEFYQNAIDNSKEAVEVDNILSSWQNEVASLKGKKLTPNEGQLYKLSVPKNDVMLREGASFENQPELVQKGLNNIKKDYLKSKGYNSIDDINAELDSLSNQYENIVKNDSPYNFYAGNEKSEIQAKISQLENLRRFNETPDLYDYLLKHQHLEPHEVSDLLYKQGIKGISYNGGIDGEAAVIFNPDDIDIVRKYYNQPSLWEQLKGLKPNEGAELQAIENALRNPKYPMSNEDFNAYEDLGLNYYKNIFQPNTLNIDDYGIIHFNRKNRGKDDITNFKVYPDLFEQLTTAHKGKNTNYKNELDRNYDYLYNTYNNDLYEYLIENIDNVGKRYKMMRNKRTGK